MNNSVRNITLIITIGFLYCVSLFAESPTPTAIPYNNNINNHKHINYKQNTRSNLNTIESNETTANNEAAKRFRQCSDNETTKQKLNSPAANIATMLDKIKQRLDQKTDGAIASHGILISKTYEMLLAVESLNSILQNEKLNPLRDIGTKEQVIKYCRKFEDAFISSFSGKSKNTNNDRRHILANSSYSAIFQSDYSEFADIMRKKEQENDRRQPNGCYAGFNQIKYSLNNFFVRVQILFTEFPLKKRCSTSRRS